METPLPCPFCGGEVAPYQGGNYHPDLKRYYMKCWNNYCEVNPGIDIPSHSEKEVIHRWNKRKAN